VSEAATGRHVSKRRLARFAESVTSVPVVVTWGGAQVSVREAPFGGRVKLRKVLAVGGNAGAVEPAAEPRARFGHPVYRLAFAQKIRAGLLKQVADASSRVANSMVCHLGRAEAGRRGLLFGGFMDRNSFHLLEPQFELVNLRP